MQCNYGDSRLPAQFWSKIELVPFSTCWIWRGNTAFYKRQPTYGLLWSRAKQRMVLAHRLAYTGLVGPIPTGTELDHFYCNVKSCVNPAHVRPVTHFENVVRSDTSLAAINLAKKVCVKGHPLRKLFVRSTNSVRRYCYECNLLSIRVAARNYGRRKRLEKKNAEKNL